MNLDERLALARDLIARRDAIDAELEALFAGAPLKPAGRRQRRSPSGSDGEGQPQERPEDFKPSTGRSGPTGASDAADR